MELNNSIKPIKKIFPENNSLITCSKKKPTITAGIIEIKIKYKKV